MIPQIKGANATAFNSKLPELILSGPARCGKTFALLHKIQHVALTYPDLRIAMMRKTRVSMNETTLETWESEIYPSQYLNSHVVNRKSRTEYTYPNRSRVHLFGMDNPEKFLSSQWDLIYVNECTELEEEEWDLIGSRLLRNKAPFRQLMGDCNPPKQGKGHWVWKRHEREQTKLIFSEHGLNPTVTEENLQRLATLRGDLNRRFYAGSWDAIPQDGMFKPHWFKYLDAMPGHGEWARGWDIASGESEEADESAGALVGLCRIDGNPNAIVIADMTKGRWSPHARNERMRLCAESDMKYEAKGYFEKGFGIGTDMTLSVIEALSGYSMWAVKPKGSKAFRADPLAAQCEAGNVYLVRGDWNNAFVMECCEFTGEEGGKDNQVDAVSLAYNMLTR